VIDVSPVSDRHLVMQGQDSVPYVRINTLRTTSHFTRGRITMSECNCKDLSGKKIKRVKFYVKKKPSRMNPKGFTNIGLICPQCGKTKVTVKGFKN